MFIAHRLLLALLCSSPASPVTNPNALFAWTVRVYWEDTDAGGVVYHASYLRFLERARTEYFRTLGIGQEILRRDSNVVFVVRDVSMRFVKPAKLDDALTVSVHLQERRPASLAFQQSISRAVDGAILVEAKVRAACVSADSFRPRAIPDDLFPEFSNP
jgi:acyl-CoA thioester hydrolase